MMEVREEEDSKKIINFKIIEIVMMVKINLESLIAKEDNLMKMMVIIIRKIIKAESLENLKNLEKKLLRINNNLMIRMEANLMVKIKNSITKNQENELFLKKKNEKRLIIINNNIL